MAAQQPARTSPELRARLHSARANVGITPRPGALPKSDKEVIFKAASEAQKALDYINNLTNQTQEQEAA